VVVDPRADSRVGLQTCFDNVVTGFIVNGRTDVLKTDINLFFAITNCRTVLSRSLTHRVDYKFMCLFAYTKKLQVAGGIFHGISRESAA